MALSVSPNAICPSPRPFGERVGVRETPTQCPNYFSGEFLRSML